MKVKLRTTMAGPDGHNYHPGQVADLPQATAYALCEGGFAEQVEEMRPAVEAAVAPQRETTEAPANRRRKRAP